MPQSAVPSPIPSQKPTPVGPTVGIIIIVLLLFLGALYFWGERLNREASNPPPYIPGDSTSTPPVFEAEVQATATLSN